MKRWLLALPVLLISSYFLAPAKYLFELNNFIEMKIAGVKVKNLEINANKISYYQGGNGDKVVVLLHGFGGSKENWNKLSMNLTKNFQVYAMDLPGFGGSDFIADKNTIEDFRDTVIRFIEKIGHPKIKLVGHSTGGLIAAQVAKKIPHVVEDLWLITPAGATGNFKSEMSKQLSEGKNVLIPESLDDFQLMMDVLFYKSPFIPSKVVEFLGNRHIKSSERLKMIFQSTHKVHNNRTNISPTLNEILEGYPHNIFLSWGKEDRIINYRLGISIKEQFPKINLNIEEKVGHMYLIEYPEVPKNF